jgi:prolipoprotein diacylglyceryltransferase
MINVFSQPLQLFGTALIFLLLVVIYVFFKEKLNPRFAETLKYTFYIFLISSCIILFILE